MPAVTVELSARQETVGLPIFWRLGKLFNVVTNVCRARVSEDLGQLTLGLEGSNSEVDQALDYLRALGIYEADKGGTSPSLSANPETSVVQGKTIAVRISTVNPAQAHAPILYRVCKDYNVVLNIERAAFDDEEGGYVDVVISGPLAEVQRSIAYLHTTGVHVNPRQRSVTDYSNL